MVDEADCFLLGSVTMLEVLPESITAEAYHALPGVSNAMVKDFIDDPRLYYHKYVLKSYKRERQSHFDFGSAVHDISLLGDKSGIVLIPREVLASNGAKSGGKWEAWEAEHKGKILLKAAEYDSVMRCVDAVRKHPVAGRLLAESGVSEAAFAADFSDLQLTLRCRPDRLLNKGICLDIKTTEATRPEKFVRSIDSYGYANQEYFYRKVLAEHSIKVDAFIFIAVAKDQPHTVDCYQIDEAWLSLAQDTVEGALSDIARRTIANDWSVETDSKIVRLSPPSYIKYKGQYAL